MNGKGKASALVLPLFLALAATPVWADESGVEGATAGSDLISGTAWDPLASVSASVPNSSVGSDWFCAVTCSTEVGHLGGFADGRVGILKDGALVTGTDRTFEINDNPGIDDLAPIEVSTTGVTTISESLDPTTLACAAAKISDTAADPDFNINDSSISVACSDFTMND